MIKCDFCSKECDQYYLYDNNILCEKCSQDKWDLHQKQVHNLQQECQSLYSDFCKEHFSNKDKLESIRENFYNKADSLKRLIRSFETVNNTRILSKQEAIEYKRQNNSKQADSRHSDLKKIWKAEAEEDRKLRQQIKTVSFDVVLIAAGANKLAVVKLVKEITNLNIRESKEMVDGAPCVIKGGLTKADAEGLKKQLEEAGAEVVLK